jgi:hypothetical protein
MKTECVKPMGPPVIGHFLACTACGTSFFKVVPYTPEIENRNFLEHSADHGNITGLPRQCPHCAGREMFRLEFL